MTFLHCDLLVRLSDRRWQVKRSLADIDIAEIFKTKRAKFYEISLIAWQYLNV
jgi:hypothetical protein